MTMCVSCLSQRYFRRGRNPTPGVTPSLSRTFRTPQPPSPVHIHAGVSAGVSASATASVAGAGVGSSVPGYPHAEWAPRHTGRTAPLLSSVVKAKWKSEGHVSNGPGLGFRSTSSGIAMRQPPDDATVTNGDVPLRLHGPLVAVVEETSASNSPDLPNQRSSSTGT